jgi:hypothetical protein
MMKAGGEMRKEKNQYLSRPDVQAYLRKYPDATAEEKRDLVKRLKSGESPTTNDCSLWDDRGYPMDFINARRNLQALIQQNSQHLDESDEAGAIPVDDSYEPPF